MERIARGFSFGDISCHGGNFNFRANPHTRATDKLAPPDGRGMMRMILTSQERTLAPAAFSKEVSSEGDLPGKNINRIVALVLALFAGTVGYFRLMRRPPVSNRDSAFTSMSGKPGAAWQVIDAETFFVSIPPDWTFRKLQGIDSYVGEIVGEGARLEFDYGDYSNTLADPSDPSYIVSYESIHGRRAKIVVPKTFGKGMTGVYFGNLGGTLTLNRTAFNLVGQNLSLSQQETALQIFRTLQFKKISRMNPSDTNPFR